MIFGIKSDNQFSRPIVRIAVTGIAIGIAVMILTIAIVRGFQFEIRDKVIGFTSHIQITNYDSNNSFEPSPIDKNQSFYPIIEKNPDVKHIQIYATKNGIIKTKTNNEGILLKGVGPDYDWSFIRKNLVEGEEMLTISDTGNPSRGIIISNVLASKLEVKLNDKLLVYFVTKKKNSNEGGNKLFSYEQRVKDFYIKGIYETGFEEFDKKTAFIDIRQIQKLNYWEKSQIGGFEIFIKNDKNIEKEGENIDNLVGENLNAQTIKQLYPTIFSWLDLQDINAIIVITLMILVATINMISALLILILERINMIGVLKALGATNKSIQKIFLYNAAYLVGKGLLWGNITGIIICILQKQYGLFKLAKETYYVSVIPIEMNLNYIFLLNAVTFIICLFMLIIPSFIISKITPVKSIRFK